MSTDKKRGGNFIMLFATLILLLMFGGIGVGAFYFVYLYCEMDFWVSLFCGLLVYTVLPAVIGNPKEWNKETHRYEEVSVSDPVVFTVTRIIAFIGMVGIILGWIFDWI